MTTVDKLGVDIIGVVWYKPDQAIVFNRATGNTTKGVNTL